MIAGHLQIKNDYYYMVLSYLDANGKRKQPWFPTGLPIKNNKKRAEKMLLELRQTYVPPAEHKSNGELSADMLFADFMELWLEVVRNSIREKLLALKEQQKENKRICGNCYNREYDGYVFVDVMGNIFNPRNLSSNFSKLLELKGLRHIRFHDLRHSCASLLLANDVPMKQIQEWLGHSDISTTANIYSHLDYKSKLTSANVMDNVLTLPETEAVGWQT